MAAGLQDMDLNGVNARDVKHRCPRAAQRADGRIPTPAYGGTDAPLTVSLVNLC